MGGFAPRGDFTKRYRILQKKYCLTIQEVQWHWALERGTFFVHCWQQPCNHKFYRGRLESITRTDRNKETTRRESWHCIEKTQSRSALKQSMANWTKTGMLALGLFVSLLSICFCGFFSPLFVFVLTLAFGLNYLSSLDLFWSYCNAITVENVL